MAGSGEIRWDGEPIDVLVVADVRLYREGLAEALDRQPSLRVVATAAGLQGAVAAAQHRAPHVAVVDLGMPDGLVAVRRLTHSAPSLRIVALPLVEEPEQVVAWAEAGISGYVTRDGSIDELVTAVIGAMREELTCSQRVAAALLRRVGTLATAPGDRSPRTRLTRREREVVALIDEGLANKEIATRLQIEVPTVKNHVHNILEKVGARRRSEAAWRVRCEELDQARAPLPR